MTQTDGTIEPGLRSHPKQVSVVRNCPFPVGVEYYRAPVPPSTYWDEDMARIRAAGMRIVRSFTAWNWIETRPGEYEFDDLDLFFDLAAKHDLKVWLDTPVGTHMACPEWIIRRHPDMRVEWSDGSVQQPTAGAAMPQGTMIHNFDHPKWREYVERFIGVLVERYKDHPAMGIWGTWDGINFAAAWAIGRDVPSYNAYTIEKYRSWLQKRYNLDQLNDRLLRRFRAWQDVEPPRSPEAIVEMILYREFHYENMAAHLGWLADLIDRLDGNHEQRSHGASFPRQWDEVCSRRVDSWGLSHHSAGRLTSDDAYSVANECFGFQWARAVGKNGRWWNEEIYSSFVGGLGPLEKRTIPQESVVFLWLSLIEGATGAMFWQYRPEYMSFEGPGLNLVALDGKPTERVRAVSKAIAEIDTIAAHLPMSIPRPSLALGYSAVSHEVFSYTNQQVRFIHQLRGVYRTLWANSIPQDIITPGMDWSDYKAIYLPNFAVLDETALTRIRQVLLAEDDLSLVVDGHFGTFSGKGHWSFCPPEGLADLVDARIADFDVVDQADIRAGRNILRTEYGAFPIQRPCQYAILECGRTTKPVGTLDEQTVAIASADRRFTWYGVPLSVTSCSAVAGQPATDTAAGVGHPDLVLPLFASLGVVSPFLIEGDRVVAFRRISVDGDSLVFVLNLERKTAQARVTPRWGIRSARNLFKSELPLRDGGFEIEAAFGEVLVIHCTDT